MNRKQSDQIDQGSVAANSRRAFLKTTAIAAAVPFLPGLVTSAKAQPATHPESDWPPVLPALFCPDAGSDPWKYRGWVSAA